MLDTKRIKLLRITLEVEGDEKFKTSMEFTDTKLMTALLQQKALLEAELGLVIKQLEGKI